MKYTDLSPMHIIPMSMEEVIEDRFPDVHYNYSSNIQYQECVALETEVLPQMDGYIVEFRHIEEILMNLTSSDIQEALPLAETLSSYYDEIINVGQIYHEYNRKLNEACDWIKHVLSHQNSLLDKGTVKEKELDSFLNEIHTTWVKIRNAYSALQRYYVSIIHPDIQILQSYLIGNITKVELSDKLKSMWESNDVVIQLNEDLQILIREYSTKMTLAKEGNVEDYRKLLTVDFPLINRENVYELELVKKSAAINDSRLQEIVDNLKVDVIHYLPELIRECYDRLIESMREIRYGLIRPVEAVVVQLDELIDELEKYRKSTIMDTDFFM